MIAEGTRGIDHIEPAAPRNDDRPSDRMLVCLKRKANAIVRFPANAVTAGRMLDRVVVGRSGISRCSRGPLGTRDIPHAEAVALFEDPWSAGQKRVVSIAAENWRLR